MRDLPIDELDWGLFGPGSVTWRLHADPILGVAGLRALMLQALHPRAAQAFDELSTFREDVWGRLSRTVDFIGATTFDSTPEALAAGARVRAVHSAFTATDPQTGESYRLDDPGLLRWVHCCLVDSVLDVTRRAGIRVDDEDADRYVHEQVRAAVLVGLEPDEVPQDVAGLADTLRGYRPLLRATASARDEVRHVVAPPMPVRVAVVGRPAWFALAGLAFAALPGWARRLYALPDLPGAARLHASATTVALHALHASLRGVQAVVPALREGPHLRTARERLAEAPHGGSGHELTRDDEGEDPASPAR